MFYLIERYQIQYQGNIDISHEGSVSWRG